MRLYLILGVVLAFTALAGVAAWYGWDAAAARAEAAQARADLETALASNRALEATVGRLRASEAANDKLMAEMADTLERISNEVAELDDDVYGLKETDDEVRDYLANPVPLSLRELLDR